MDDVALMDAVCSIATTANENRDELAPRLHALNKVPSYPEPLSRGRLKLSGGVSQRAKSCACGNADACVSDACVIERESCMPREPAQASSPCRTRVLVL